MMCISTKGRYAVRVMVFLARWPGRPLTKREISEEEDISPGYLQQILGSLVNADLVTSYRGTAGGFSLAREPESITIGEVLRCTEGAFSPAPCERPEDCSRAPRCPTRPFWMKAASVMAELMDGTTIADLANDARYGPVPDRAGDAR